MTDHSNFKHNQLPQPWLNFSIENFSQKTTVIDHSPWLSVEKGFRHRDDIEVFDTSIFGDKKGHILDMSFFDGFAIQCMKYDDDAPLVMLYPMGDYLWNNKEMSLDILDFSGNDFVTPFEVALKYGRLFTYYQIKSLITNIHTD